MQELTRKDKESLRIHVAYMEAKATNEARQRAWARSPQGRDFYSPQYRPYDEENDISLEGLHSANGAVAAWLNNWTEGGLRTEFAEIEDSTHFELVSDGLPNEGMPDWDAIRVLPGWPEARGECPEILERYGQEATRIYRHKATGEEFVFRVGPEDPEHGWTERYGWLGHAESNLAWAWRQEQALPRWLSKRHEHLRAHSMKPWPYSPISLDGQESYLAEMRQLVDHDLLRAQALNPLVMLGPPGCSKTAMAHAILMEHHTFRWAQYHYPGLSHQERQDWKPMHDRGTYGIYRVSAREWLAQWHDYKTRNLNSTAKVKKPSVTAERIKRDAKENCGCPPVLWLEEVDSFTATVEKLGLLLSLIDVVYELGGMIVLTSNATPTELRDLLESVRPGLYRRLTGECDGPGSTLWNMHTRAKTHPAKPKAKPKGSC